MRKAVGQNWECSLAGIIDERIVDTSSIPPRGGARIAEVGRIDSLTEANYDVCTMGMSKMRGDLADAIRGNHVSDVKQILKKYQEESKPDYLEKIRDKYLKDAARTAANIQRRNQQIIEAINTVRVSRALTKNQQA